MKNCTLINLDTEGRIISWNKDAEGIMGYRSEEILGHNIACLYQKNDIERDKPNNELIVAKIKGHFADEGYRVRKNGTQFYANVIITPLRDDSGKLKEFLEIIYEITERKLEEEVLRRLNRELRAIRNCNQILLRAVDEQTLLNEICHVICNEAGYILAWWDMPRMTILRQYALKHGPEQTMGIFRAQNFLGQTTRNGDSDPQELLSETAK